MRRLILRNAQSPGDLVMLTAAVRDLHTACPGRFLTDVRTPCPGLWENNPHLTPLTENAPDVETIQCEYPLIHHSNQRPYHFIHAFARFLSEKLGVIIEPTAFKGDIHLSDAEKSWMSQVQEVVEEDIPFWIVNAGGKRDFTAKWWAIERYQQVVDHFRGRIQFVQVGEAGHHHPALRGVIDLRGKTDVRQFVRLMYHAQGVLCPVTFAMHLAAAVETKPGMPKNRPCVVVAGGREPMQWEAYPHHQYIHTNGALRCCDQGGCWKSRVVPLGDGDEKDKPENLCVDVVGTLPRCLDMIQASDVIRRIETYFEGGAIRYLNEAQQRAADKVLLGHRIKMQFPSAALQEFASFQNRYAGQTCYIVGRGPTEFDYQALEEFKEPVFFINDAVALEKHCQGDTYFFAHDAKQLVWLKRAIKSVPVLPIDGKIFAGQPDFASEHQGKIVFYRWPKTGGETLLRFSREELARRQELYTHCGTIHSLLHFVWFCGFKKIIFVGCDGINSEQELRERGHPTSGYDRRLENASRTSPWWQYNQIRQVQDRLCDRFGLQKEYIGTPQHQGLRAQTLFPKIGHFVWLGGPLPKFAQENIDRFRSLHPDWDVRVWMSVPADMPDDLVRMIYSTDHLSMRSDIIRFWLVHEYGGLYLDTDEYVLRNMDELRRHDFFVTRAHDPSKFYIGVLGGPPRSASAAQILATIRQLQPEAAKAAGRCCYGPDVVQKVHSQFPNLLTILPRHYFYIFKTQETAIRFAQVGADEQSKMLEAVAERVTDGVETYAIHTWGIPRKMSHPYYLAARSSWEKNLVSTDALLRSLPSSEVQGAVLGDSDGRLSAYLLGHHPRLHLTMLLSSNGAREEVASASDGEALRETSEMVANLPRTGTDFAANRRKIAEWDTARVLAIPDKSLDFVLASGGDYAGEGSDLVSSWLPKLKSGGAFWTSKSEKALQLAR